MDHDRLNFWSSSAWIMQLTTFWHHTDSQGSYPGASMSHGKINTHEFHKPDRPQGCRDKTDAMMEIPIQSMQVIFFTSAQYLNVIAIG